MGPDILGGNGAALLLGRARIRERRIDAESDEGRGRDVSAVRARTSAPTDGGRESRGREHVDGIGAHRNGYEDAAKDKALPQRRSAGIDELRQERCEE